MATRGDMVLAEIFQIRPKRNHTKFLPYSLFQVGKGRIDIGALKRFPPLRLPFGVQLKTPWKAIEAGLEI